MTDTARTVVLKPGDTLYIGNVGQISGEVRGELYEGLAHLSAALGLNDVVLFLDDIDMAAVAPITPLPDAVVLRVFDRKAMAQHRKVLAAWLTANGIDPMTVSDQWLSIEQLGEQRLIRYTAYRTTPEGGRLIDPRDRNSGWTVERVSPLVVDLEIPAGQTVTEGDDSP